MKSSGHQKNVSDCRIPVHLFAFCSERDFDNNTPYSYANKWTGILQSSQEMLLFLSPAEFPNCDGRVAIITGGNRGIGLETVKGLCKANVTVIIGMYCKDWTELM